MNKIFLARFQSSGFHTAFGDILVLRNHAAEWGCTDNRFKGRGVNFPEKIVNVDMNNKGILHLMFTWIAPWLKTYFLLRVC